MTEAPAEMIERAFAIEIDAPIDKVWNEITKTHSLQRAMFDTMLEAELRPGGRLRYRSANGKRTFIFGEVIEAVSPTRFVHTFAFSNLDDAPTLVAWDLEPTGTGGVRVTVTHSRFVGETKTFKSVNTVWPQILGRIKALAEGRNLSVKDRMMFRMMGAMQFMLPKSTLSENVDQRAAQYPSEIH
jgi:uncharacterized protein YndB with AHSA1/START domain